MLPYIVIIAYLSLVDKATHCSLGELSLDCNLRGQREARRWKWADTAERAFLAQISMDARREGGVL